MRPELQSRLVWRRSNEPGGMVLLNSYWAYGFGSWNEKRMAFSWLSRDSSLAVTGFDANCWPHQEERNGDRSSEDWNHHL
jgi:hypothetical protein